MFIAWSIWTNETRSGCLCDVDVSARKRTTKRFGLDFLILDNNQPHMMACPWHIRYQGAGSSVASSTGFVAFTSAATKLAAAGLSLSGKHNEMVSHHKHPWTEHEQKVTHDGFPSLSLSLSSPTCCRHRQHFFVVMVMFGNVAVFKSTPSRTNLF